MPIKEETPATLLFTGTPTHRRRPGRGQPGQIRRAESYSLQAQRETGDGSRRATTADRQSSRERSGTAAADPGGVQRRHNAESTAERGQPLQGTGIHCRTAARSRTGGRDSPGKSLSLTAHRARDQTGQRDSPAHDPGRIIRRRRKKMKEKRLIRNLKSQIFQRWIPPVTCRRSGDRNPFFYRHRSEAETGGKRSDGDNRGRVRARSQSRTGTEQRPAGRAGDPEPIRATRCRDQNDRHKVRERGSRSGSRPE